MVVEQPLHQHRVADRFAEAADHGRDLGIEDRVGDDAGKMMHDFDVLAARMEHLQDPLIHHEVEKGFQIKARREAVDQDLGAFARHLDEAELRPEGLLAHELGVEGHKRGLGQLRAGFGQFFGTRDQMHGADIA